MGRRMLSHLITRALAPRHGRIVFTAPWSLTFRGGPVRSLWSPASTTSNPIGSFAARFHSRFLGDKIQPQLSQIARILLRSKLVFVVGPLLVGATALCWMWDWQARRFVSAFERNTIALAEGKLLSLEGPLMNRPELHRVLVELLHPAETSHYVVVVGAHGTGKSTAVIRAARDAEAGGGVVYVSVKNPKDFNSHLCAVLSGVPYVFVPLRILSDKLRAWTQAGTNSTNVAAEPEPMHSWSPLAEVLRKAADIYIKKHKQPMTLVIDNAHKLPREFLLMLQLFAKETADDNSISLVLVSSDYVVGTLLATQSEWSRHIKLEIDDRDIDYNTAVDYVEKKLRQRHLSPQQDALDYLVKSVTGGNVLLLNQAIRLKYHTLPQVLQYERDLIVEKQVQLAQVKLPSSVLCALGRLLQAEEPFHRKLVAEEAVLAVGVNSDQLQQLVKTNILVKHKSGQYSCSAHYVIKMLLEKQHAAGNNSAGPQHATACVL
eukprot:GDKI01035192.1.p1 GENE.GDKI01035192.1~~GDKI01035192.1.p1  ORF type:complete len:489 (+),score=97.88 GDKI01035192.1:1-1467(+)